MSATSMTARKKAVLSLLVLLLTGLALSGVTDRTGRDYTDAAFERALITFGVARGLNAAISVAQGTEISISPAGVGLHLTPGQMLDPVNDLIERFSMVMLVSTASLGVQKVLLNIAASVVFSVLLVGVLVGALLALWRPGLLAGIPAGYVYRIALVLVLLRFAVPIAAIGSELIYEGFLSEQYLESTEALEQTSRQISKLNQQDAAQSQADEGWIERIKNAGRQLDFDKRIAEYKEVASQASEEAINLIVVFVMQTLLLPLLFLWLLVRALRSLWS